MIKKEKDTLGVVKKFMTKRFDSFPHSLKYYIE